MHRTALIATLSALLVSTQLVQPRALSAASPGAVRQPGCNTLGYEPALCYTVPRSGGFLVWVPGTLIVLGGTGSPQTAGTSILVAPVSDPCAATRSQSFKLFHDGPMPALYLMIPGRLYQYVYGRGWCQQVSAVPDTGLYQVVYPGGSMSGSATHP